MGGWVYGNSKEKRALADPCAPKRPASTQPCTLESEEFGGGSRLLVANRLDKEERHLARVSLPARKLVARFLREVADGFKPLSVQVCK